MLDTGASPAGAAPCRLQGVPGGGRRQAEERWTELVFATCDELSDKAAVTLVPDDAFDMPALRCGRVWHAKWKLVEWVTRANDKHGVAPRTNALRAPLHRA